MCLNKIIGKAKNEKKEYTGYKVFVVESGSPTFPFYNQMSFQVGVKLTANRMPVYADSGRYTSGFHIFRTVAAAKLYRSSGVVYKVKYSGYVTKGLQECHGRMLRCDVAKFMTILEVGA